MVRTETLEPLSHIPESWWGIQNIQSEAMPLVVAKARKAIEDRLDRETSEAKENLRTALSALEAAVSEKSLEDECGRITLEVGQRIERIAALDVEFLLRRNALENRFRELEAFLRERASVWSRLISSRGLIWKKCFHL